MADRTRRVLIKKSTLCTGRKALNYKSAFGGEVTEGTLKTKPQRNSKKKGKNENEGVTVGGGRQITREKRGS